MSAAEHFAVAYVSDVQMHGVAMVSLRAIQSNMNPFTCTSMFIKMKAKGPHVVLHLVLLAASVKHVLPAFLLKVLLQMSSTASRVE